MYLVFKTSKPGCRDGLIDRVLAHENMRIRVHMPRTNVKTGHLGQLPAILALRRQKLKILRAS